MFKPPPNPMRGARRNADAPKTQVRQPSQGKKALKAVEGAMKLNRRVKTQ